MMAAYYISQSRDLHESNKLITLYGIIDDHGMNMRCKTTLYGIIYAYGG